MTTSDLLYSYNKERAFHIRTFVLAHLLIIGSVASFFIVGSFAHGRIWEILLSLAGISYICLWYRADRRKTHWQQNNLEMYIRQLPPEKCTITSLTEEEDSVIVGFGNNMLRFEKSRVSVLYMLSQDEVPYVTYKKPDSTTWHITKQKFFDIKIYLHIQKVSESNDEMR